MKGRKEEGKKVQEQPEGGDKYSELLHKNATINNIKQQSANLNFSLW